MKITSITLDEPLDLPSGKLSTVYVREPRAGDVMDIGEPVLLARSETGALISVESEEKIRQYIDVLLMDDARRKVPVGSIRNASAVDYLRIRDAVLDFFTQARQRIWSTPSAS